eukprot:285303-Chlamydomonas_euryale.AAC.2
MHLARPIPRKAPPPEKTDKHDVFRSTCAALDQHPQQFQTAKKTPTVCRSNAPRARPPGPIRHTSTLPPQKKHHCMPQHYTRPAGATSRQIHTSKPTRLVLQQNVPGWTPHSDSSTPKKTHPPGWTPHSEQPGRHTHHVTADAVRQFAQDSLNLPRRRRIVGVAVDLAAAAAAAAYVAGRARLANRNSIRRVGLRALLCIAAAATYVVAIAVADVLGQSEQHARHRGPDVW